MKTKLRTLLPVVSGMLILVASLAYIRTPPSPEMPIAQAGQVVPVDTGNRVQLDVSTLPSAESIVRHTWASGNGARHHRMEWRISDDAAPAMIRFLETDPRVIHYRAGRVDSGWQVEARIADAPSEELPDGSDRWDSLLSDALVRPLSSASPGESEQTRTGVQESPSPGHYRNGSGFVRFTDRGTMYWLWDEEVLRLEQVR